MRGTPGWLLQGPQGSRAGSRVWKAGRLRHGVSFALRHHSSEGLLRLCALAAQPGQALGVGRGGNKIMGVSNFSPKTVGSQRRCWSWTVSGHLWF